MKRTINNPHKVNHKIYIYLTVLFLVLLFFSYIIPIEKDETIKMIADVIKNLSYGCIASTVVAWLIDITNTNSLNKKTNNIYDAVYADLKFRIGCFVGTWAEICSVAFTDKNYSEEKYTWNVWYKITKDRYNNCELERQKHLLDFFYTQLSQIEKEINKSIEYLQSQRYMLTMNDVMNKEMDRILSDFQFEFYALNLELSRKRAPEMFWAHMDAITSDLINYIENWSDIRYYNDLLFKPYEFFKNTDEMIAAVLMNEEVYIAKRKRLTQRQELIQEISNIKNDAKREAHGSACAEIQIATKGLQAFYSKQDVREEQSFLIWRYIKLEMKDKIWTLLCIPAFLSVVLSVFSLDWLIQVFSALEKVGPSKLVDVLTAVSQMELLVRLKVYGLAVVILLGVILIVYILISFIKLIVNSLTRNPDTTIIENELCILRVLLQQHKILLDENSEGQRIKSLFKR